MIKANSYAKINLALDVLYKRPDGYHEVNMIMQSIGLADNIIVKKHDSEIKLTTNNPYLACDESNLIYRAAMLLKNTLNLGYGAHIHLEKNIPIAAGLAGGSSNAATTLIALNKLWKLGLSSSELLKLGAILGSDVPFCLLGGTVRAHGRGELLEVLPALRNCFVILAKPNIEVSTAWVYNNLQLPKITARPDIDKMVKALALNDFDSVVESMANVLETVTIPAYPEVARLKKIMSDYGAITLMSGSGPTVFGLANDKKHAFSLADLLREQTKADIFITETITGVGI